MKPLIANKQERVGYDFGKPQTAFRDAFTLIEIIAVLAIIAILAAALAPALVKEADFAANTVESTNLATLANAFQQAALHQRYLPGSNNWDAFMATSAGWQLNAVQTNSHNHARAFLIDPNLVIGAVHAGNLPYQQDISGSSWQANQPSNVRFMIVSSMAQIPLPSSIDFTNLWTNQPNSIPAGWTGFTQGSDILIQRINMSGMFHLLVLNNISNAVMGWNFYGTTPFTTTTSINGYFFTTTPYELFITNSIGQPKIETAQILLQDCTYTYQCGIWRMNPPISHQNIVETFAANQFGTNSPALVLNNMINYMANYAAYAASNFNNSGLQTTLRSNQATLSNSLNSLTH